MKKTLLYAVLLLSLGCKKSSSQKPNEQASVSFTSRSSSSPVASQTSYSFGAVLECFYYTNNPEVGYKFNFINPIGGAYNGVDFAVPYGPIVVNQTTNYRFVNGKTPDLSSSYTLFDGPNPVSGDDSAAITINFSRFSNGTLDGTFSIFIWGGSGGFATITEGAFENIPVKKQ